MSLPATSLAVQSGTWAALTADGEFLSGTLTQTPDLPRDAPLLVCHAPYTFTRLNMPPAPTLDVLELFLFTHPARFCTPTTGGLCRALNLPVPQTADDAAQMLFTCVDEMLKHLQSLPELDKLALIAMASAMGMAWGWTQAVIHALGGTYNPQTLARPREALNTWDKLPEWSDDAPAPPPANINISADAARNHLHDLITRRNAAGRTSTPRTAQDNFTTRIIRAFDVREVENEPHIVTAEAGTGVGKTLGYLAPAQLWAESAEGAVWVSTYTRNLQRQIDTELQTLYPDARERAGKAVIRKGRENYLCLQNLSDQVGEVITARDPRSVVATALMARWASATRDGDLSGNDFPGWISGLLGAERTTGLADKRGECSYAACDHYNRCFIERATRKSRHARVIIGNHALAMINLSLADDDTALPTRFVFDEGHHLFDAADSTFAAHLTAMEAADLRRWILGPEDESAPRTRRARRSRGLRKRLEGLIPDDAKEIRYLEDVLHAARLLPAPTWRKSMQDATPNGAIETLLYAISLQVRARAPDATSPWSIECDLHPVSDAVHAAAPAAIQALGNIRKPLLQLSAYLRHRLESEYDDLGADMRARLDTFARALERRADMTIGAWIRMLEGLENATQNAAFVDWFEITRIDARDVDVGMFRHHLDPTIPFADALKIRAHGVVMTSATLKDSRADTEATWEASDRRTGAALLSPVTPERVSIHSPFDYKNQTRVLIVRDIPKGDTMQLARAYEALFKASNGGALGLFTAIGRLRAVHGHMAARLESSGIPLYAQHVDDMDIGTLIDIFREEENACLLGTDAVRDGVDVPGHSLRLIAFDRVPWPRPTILHRARRAISGGRDYDESITRMKLRQAYGRLIRAQSDRGIFVLLDSGFPTRLEDSFPEGVPVERTTLDNALKITREFFGE